MEFGIRTWVWACPVTTEKLTRLVPHIAELGFDLIELPIENTTDIDYLYAAKLIRDYNLNVSVGVVMPSPERDLLHPDPEFRKKAFSYVRHCIEATYRLGGTYLVGPIYCEGRRWMADDEQRKRDIDILVPQLCQLAEHAANHDVIMCIEPLNRYESSFLTLTSQAIELVDRVDNPAFQLMMDFFHANIEEKSIPDSIRAAGHRLRHLHAHENDRSTPGHGHIPWAEIATALRDINFDGPLVMETFDKTVEPIATAAGIWQPLAEDTDNALREGLAFLRRLFNQY